MQAWERISGLLVWQWLELENEFIGGSVLKELMTDSCEDVVEIATDRMTKIK